MIIGVFLTVLALVATLGSVFAPRFWLADLAVHFRLQYAALALAGCLILAATAHERWAALAFLVAAIQALICAPLVNSRAPAAAAAGPAPSTTLRLAAVNVWYRNHEFQRVVEFILRERPDAVLLAEVTAEWEQALAPLGAHYAQRFATRGTRGTHGTGLLLLSRWPMQAAVLPGFSDIEPAVSASLSINDRSVQLLCVHTSWPIGRENSAVRDRQLVLVGDFARRQTQPLIVLGDLNVSPFSRHFQTLLGAANLKSAAQGFGWQPTWPTFLPLAGIQIDHALTGAGVLVTSFRRGAPVGSDHLPIVIDCVL
ncbi:MAG TPA: endonuclease/exonuclease/phosphatase family protein [Steroidobacteraceae bacterium]|nr:endonuclease/exonuclease/phosphatase family protein [Steroidobacteraceae bacterium]